MASHSNLIHYSSAAEGNFIRGANSDDAFERITCSHCGDKVGAAVIARTDRQPPQVVWLRCPSCGRGSVINGSRLDPTPLVGEQLEGLPDDIAAAYREARQTASVYAFTSCELMCRKILMHVAVDKGAAEGKSFLDYLDYLSDSGYITPTIRPWIDLIRRHGNQSTHELLPASSERALATLTFTTQLLNIVYAMEHQMQQLVQQPDGPRMTTHLGAAH